MSMHKGRTWKMERASVSRNDRSRSNKYSSRDSKPKPGPGKRQQVWVGGYTRSDGIRVHGHYRATPSAM
jgi:hypothetical protein